MVSYTNHLDKTSFVSTQVASIVNKIFIPLYDNKQLTKSYLIVLLKLKTLVIFLKISLVFKLSRVIYTNRHKKWIICLFRVLQGNNLSECVITRFIYTYILSNVEINVAYDLFWISRVRVMMFNATFNNISVILWQSVLLVEETGVPWEIQRPVTSHWQMN